MRVGEVHMTGIRKDVPIRDLMPKDSHNSVNILTYVRNMVY